mgnify:CR=1 FL=1
MSKGIIVAGFGAIGKTTLGNKYDNVIDMESGYYRWDNTGFENIPYEQRKGKKERPENIEWPDNYYKAIIEARKKYDVVLTSMHWHLLDFFEKNNICRFQPLSGHFPRKTPAPCASSEADLVIPQVRSGAESAFSLNFIRHQCPAPPCSM